MQGGGGGRAGTLFPFSFLKLKISNFSLSDNKNNSLLPSLTEQQGSKSHRCTHPKSPFKSLASWQLYRRKEVQLQFPTPTLVTFSSCKLRCTFQTSCSTIPVPMLFLSSEHLIMFELHNGVQTTFLPLITRLCSYHAEFQQIPTPVFETRNQERQWKTATKPLRFEGVFFLPLKNTRH